MVDTTIDAAVYTSFDGLTTRRHTCSTVPGVVYCVYIDQFLDLAYRKFSGGSWASQTVVKAATMLAIDVYYDKWTKNVTTTKLLMAYIDNESDDTLFNALDVSDDTLDGETIPLNGTTASGTVSLDQNHVSIVRAEGGNIYVFSTIDGGTELVFARSVDGGANWTSRATTGLWEASGDRIMLLPGNEADTNDIYALFYDVSAGELTLKTYDNSGDSWSESSAILSGLATTLADDNYPMAAAQRHSDGHIIAVVQTDRDTADADLKVVNITNGSTFATLTDVITNADDWSCPSILINQQNDDLYVTYVGEDDGTQIWESQVHCHYQKSTNDGSTWGGELTMSITADDFRTTSAGVSIGADGGNFMPIWFEDGGNDLFCNLDNDIEIAAAVGDSATVTGVVAEAPAAALLGVITAIVVVSASITGVVATAPAAAPIGAVEIATSITGVVAAAPAAATIGVVTSIGIVSVSGEAATAPAAAPVGVVTSTEIVSITGEPATADAAAPTGAVQIATSIAGTVAAAPAAAPAGTVQIATSITGVAATATAAALLATLTSIEIVSVSGDVATADAVALIGVITANDAAVTTRRNALMLMGTT